MNIGGFKKRTLVIGCDYPTFHSYWRNFSRSQNMDIVGFIYCFSGEPPINAFKGAPAQPIPIYPLEQLETIIVQRGIQICEMQLSGLSIPNVHSIINRITSTGTCQIEFISPFQTQIRSNKPVIEITSLAPKLGKSQLGRYFCGVLASKFDRKVAVILPINEIPKSQQLFHVECGPHYEFKRGDKVPSNVFSDDDKWNIMHYQQAGAFRVYASSYYRKAIISAEQHADVIIFDSKGCDTSFTDARCRFCVTTEESIYQVSKLSHWPGLFNAMQSSNIVVLIKVAFDEQNDSRIVISKEQKEEMGRIFGNKQIFFAASQLQPDTFASNEQLNAIQNAKSIITVEHQDNQGDSQSIIDQMGASKNQIDPSPFLTDGLDIQNKTIVTHSDRCQSPTLETTHKSDLELEKIANTINNSNADLVVVALQKDIKSINPNTKVVYTFRTIYDVDDKLSDFLDQFSPDHFDPPLKKHFEAQVDILMKMAKASDTELYVTNNDSSNREAFCRLFLSSHLPSSYKVKTGEIIDAFSNSTGQLDVVVVNDECPRMTIDASLSVIAPIMADDVLGVVEVKTTLTLEAFKQSLNQLRPVKALMTSHGTLTNPDGTIIPDPLKGKIITGIFAFRCGEAIDQHIFSTLAAYPGVIDFIVILDSHCYFSAETLDVCGLKPGDACSIVNGYCKFTARGIGLAMIFGILNCLAAVRRFSGANCVQYLSGSWGGPLDEIERTSVDATNQLAQMIDLYSGKLNSQEKQSVLKYRNQYMTYIGEFRKDENYRLLSKKSNSSRQSLRPPPSPIPPRPSSPVPYDDLSMSLSCDSDGFMFNNDKNI